MNQPLPNSLDDVPVIQLMRGQATALSLARDAESRLGGIRVTCSGVTSRRAAARHEAAHALATIALGGRVVHVEIGRDRDRRWDGVTIHVPFMGDDLEETGLLGMVFAVAGVVAERRTEDIGLLDALGYCASADLAEVDPAAHMKSARRLAREILTSFRGAHMALANALEEHTSVSGKTAAAIVYRHAPGLRSKRRNYGQKVSRAFVSLWKLARAATLVGKVPLSQLVASAVSGRPT